MNIQYFQKNDRRNFKYHIIIAKIKKQNGKRILYNNKW